MICICLFGKTRRFCEINSLIKKRIKNKIPILSICLALLKLCYPCGQERAFCYLDPAPAALRYLHSMLNRTQRAICINLIALDRPEAIRYDKFSLRPVRRYTKAGAVFPPASHTAAIINHGRAPLASILLCDCLRRARVAECTIENPIAESGHSVAAVRVRARLDLLPRAHTRMHHIPFICRICTTHTQLVILQTLLSYCPHSDLHCSLCKGLIGRER